ncbi:hypothetical protein DXG01_013429, partial [Tephrocybe rancida]
RRCSDCVEAEQLLLGPRHRFVPANPIYEGPGEIHTRGTKANHAKDDRLRAAQERANSPSFRSRLLGRRQNSPPANNPLFGRSPSPSQAEPAPPTPPSAPPRSVDDLTLIEHEVAWLSKGLVTSPTSPLVFENVPTENGPFLRSHEHDVSHPNDGLYALVPGRRSNYAYLLREARVCKLVAQVSTMEASDAQEQVLGKLYMELDHLLQQKEYSWSEQRAHLTPEKITVNTGKLTFIGVVYES